MATLEDAHGDGRRRLPECSSLQVERGVAGRSPSTVRRLARVATFIAVLTSPALFFWLQQARRLGVGWSIVCDRACDRRLPRPVDILVRRVIPWPSLFGTDDARCARRTSSTAAAPGPGASAFRSASGSSCFITIVYLVQVLRRLADIERARTGGDIVPRSRQRDQQDPLHPDRLRRSSSSSPTS